jgi:menaquinone-dependent protoporphyrinogen oxidase
MKNLIVYATTYGTVEKCADILQSGLKGDTLKINVNDKERMETIGFETFDTVIIGGSVRAGKIQSRLLDFCKKNITELQKKNLGIFICSLAPAEKAELYIRDNFPADLVQKTRALGYFGGELHFARLNMIEKFILKLIAKTDQDISRLDQERINNFVNVINTP